MPETKKASDKTEYRALARSEPQMYKDIHALWDAKLTQNTCSSSLRDIDALEKGMECRYRSLQLILDQQKGQNTTETRSTNFDNDAPLKRYEITELAPTHLSQQESARGATDIERGSSGSVYYEHGKTSWMTVTNGGGSIRYGESYGYSRRSWASKASHFFYL